MYAKTVMSLKKVLVFSLFLLAAASVFGQSEQRYYKGALFNEEAYSKLPRKAALATRAYEGLSKAFSLKQYAPLPGTRPITEPA